MTESIRPIFIVGSGRSGTSILTWCLGQPPHIIPLPETYWIGKLSKDLKSVYELGSARGEHSHLSAMGVTSAEFYEAFGDAINDFILYHPNRIKFSQSDDASRTSSSVGLERWVDGTPLNTFHIPGLLRLFPHAKFIHILRDVGSVVRSLVNFSKVGGGDYTEQAAYEYWLRSIRACVQAEQDLGPKTVLRIKYADLVSSPEEVLGSCLDFLEEPFYAECLEPLKTKINSSNVPPDFDAYDANTDPRLRESAESLSRQLLEEAYPRYSPNKEIVDKLGKALVERTESVGSSEPDNRLVSADSKLRQPGVDRQTVAGRNEDLVQKLRARNERLEARGDKLKRELHSIRNSRAWRLLGLYRRLRTRLAASKKLVTASVERTERVGSSKPGRQKARDALDKTLRENPTDISSRDRRVPIVGPARLVDPSHGLRPDLWVGDTLTFKVKTKRPIRMVTIEGALPHKFDTEIEFILTINGQQATASFKSGRPFALDVPCSIAPGTLAQIELTTSTTWCPRKVEASEDEREPSFVLSRITFEHDQLIEEAPRKQVAAIQAQRSLHGAATTTIGQPGYLSFRCNICGQASVARVEELDREAPSCKGCGSTVRDRSIIHVLSMELFSESLALPDFPRRPDITGIGMSDWDGYAIPLAHKLNYTNTYYHNEPKVDISSGAPALEGTLDFIISSDVFEHVAPPVSRAFQNVRKLLKPTGVLIFTAPYGKGAETVEHFPELCDYQIVEQDDNYVLKNITRDGVEQTFDNLVFHGGPGATLEMRLFSESSLIEEAKAAGLNVKIYKAPDFDHGIYWSVDWSLPMAMRKS